MRIGIDARFYGSRAKGLGRYTEKLIKYLQEIDQENEYYIFLTQENFDDFTPTNKNFRKVEANYSWYTFEEQIMMPRLLNKYSLDIVHFPHFNVPIWYKGDFVVTIHDLIITHFPTVRATTLSPLMYRIKQFAYERVIRRAVHKAKKIITISEFSRSDIAKYFNISADKVPITYEGVSQKEVLLDEKSEEMLKRFGVNGPYMLYVGTAYPHKNLETLVRSLKLAFEKQKPFDVVLVGKMDYFYKRLKVEVERLGLQDYIHFVGSVSEAELHTLYKNGHVYIFPSLCEGFGLPPLEAMSHGLPVLSSNIPCLTEILGDAALFFDPYDVFDMSEKICSLFSNTELRDEFVEKGFERIKRYDWKQMAEKTVDIYKSTQK